MPRRAPQTSRGICSLPDAQHLITNQVVWIPKLEMKALFFVKEFSGNKAYSEVKFFEAQPKMQGFWARITFPDNESLEGFIRNSLSFLAEDGIYLKPAVLLSTTAWYMS